MSDGVEHRHGVHRYRNVTEGVAMANEFLASRLSISEFARQKGVSYRMVKYWTTRARQLAAAADAPLSAAEPPPMELIPIGSIDEAGGIAPGTQPYPPPPSNALRQQKADVPPSIEVHLANGLRVTVGPGFSPDVLRTVVACLGARC